MNFNQIIYKSVRYFVSAFDVFKETLKGFLFFILYSYQKENVTPTGVTFLFILIIREFPYTKCGNESSF